MSETASQGGNGKAGAQTHALAEPPVRPKPETVVVQPARVTRWNRADFAGITPERVKSVLKSAERGQLEDWADLAAHILRSDPHVRSVYETRVLSVAGADFEIEPGRASSEKEERQAEQAAELARRNLDRVRGLERLFAHLLHAEHVGWAAGAHAWDEQHRRRSGEWHSLPDRVHVRDVEFANDWVTRIRTFEGGQTPRWIRVDEVPAGSFLVHIPGSINETPNLAGDLISVAFTWVLKRWALIFQHIGLEKSGNPFVIGKVEENADPAVVNELKAALENLSGEHVGVLRGASEVEVRDPPSNLGDAYSKAIDKLNDEITKALLGSTLNVDIGAIGSKAAAQSQADTTIVPRLMADARRLANTIERDWFDPLVRFNKHLFGGAIPPTPKLKFTLVQEDPPQPLVGFVEALKNSGKGIKVNELRGFTGLDPLPPEDGGEDFLEPEQRATDAEIPGFSSDKPEEPRYARIKHEPGGEWRVLDEDGNSVSVHVTKARAVEALEEYEEKRRQELEQQAQQPGAVETSDAPDGDDWGDVLALQDEPTRNAARQRIGRLRKAIVEATAETSAILDKYREQLAEELQGVTTQADAEAAIELVFEQMGEDTELEEALFRTNLKANLAGDLFVQEVELPRAKRQLSIRRLQNEEPPFLDLPFNEAIQQFIDKDVLSPEAFEELQDSERFRAFRMKREVAAKVTEQAKAHLNSLMREGPSDAEPDAIREFVDRTAADEAALGFTPNNPFYLETVYRTATGTSYGAGRYRRQTDPDVATETGFWRYVTAGDSAVRDEHAQLHGKIWEIGDPDAEAVYPPSGFNCRCAMTVLDDDEVDQSELARPVDVNAAITEGFRGNPAGLLNLPAEDES